MQYTNRRSLGTYYEKLAAKHLQSLGYVILEQNYRTRYAEIDIIAKKDNILCIIEVKYRSSLRCGMPSEAVSLAKQRNIMSAAASYIAERKLYHSAIRFDVVEIVGEYIRVISDCFGQ